MKTAHPRLEECVGHARPGLVCHGHRHDEASGSVDDQGEILVWRVVFAGWQSAGSVRCYCVIELAAAL